MHGSVAMHTLNLPQNHQKYMAQPDVVTLAFSALAVGAATSESVILVTPLPQGEVSGFDLQPIML